MINAIVACSVVLTLAALYYLAATPPRAACVTVSPIAYSDWAPSQSNAPLAATNNG